MAGQISVLTPLSACNFSARAFLVILGLFFPIFFLQLDAITHNLDPNFAFYSVRAPPLPLYPWIRID